MESGIQRGIQQGIQLGIQQSKIELAKELLDVLDNETIATKVGISIECVQQLRNEMN